MNENIMISVLLMYAGLMILEIKLYNNRVKRYTKIHENIIKSLEETIQQRKEIEKFFKTELVEDFYKQVWDRLVKDSVELSKNEYKN